VRVFKTSWFKKFSRKEDITDKKLVSAVKETEAGLHDGDLGGGLIKKRVARPGKGKSGGYRTIFVYRAGELSIFLYGFAKSDEDNISNLELDVFKKLAANYLNYSAKELAKAVTEKELVEIEYDEEISE